MGEIMNLNTQKARLDPEAVFAEPGALVEEAGLTRGQKIAALERWRLSLTERIRATGEGMAPPAGITADEAALLEQVIQALEQLRTARAGDLDEAA